MSKTELEFPEGLIFKAPNDNAPEYVKGKLSIKREELIAWLQKREGDWVNLDLKVSQSGKAYAAVDNWKPEGKRQEAPKASRAPAPNPGFDDSSIPF